MCTDHMDGEHFISNSSGEEFPKVLRGRADKDVLHGSAKIRGTLFGGITVFLTHEGLIIRLPT